jgi:hypothetical protein
LGWKNLWARKICGLEKCLGYKNLWARKEIKKKQWKKRGKLKRENCTVQSGHPEQFLNFWVICFWAVVTGVNKL